MATKTLHEYNGKKMFMKNTQETFEPHWLLRFTDEFVADYMEANNINEAIAREHLEIAICKGLNINTGKLYDYNAKVRVKTPRVKIEKASKADTKELSRFDLVEAQKWEYIEKQGKTEDEVKALMKKGGLSDEEIAEHFKPVEVKAPLF